jgi:acyl-CoA synthetase (AMP-forming)/AMP-acid ligase II
VTGVQTCALPISHARREPQGIAFRERGRTLSWQAVHDRLGQVAHALVAGGVQPGDRVALLAHPSLPAVECLLGTVAARACVVPLPASASVATLQTLLDDAGARLLFFDPDTGPAALDLVDGLERQGRLGVVRFGSDGAEGAAYAAWRQQGVGPATLPQARADDAFNIIYSSGTTGQPKGIVHLHGMRQRQAQRQGFGFSPGSRLLLATPIDSNTTLTPLLGSLAQGGQCTLMRKFDAAGFLALAAQGRATHTMLVPVQYQRLLAHPDFGHSDLSSLALSQSTGAPMDVALKREILARWPGRFLEVYGLTEGGVSCFLEAGRHPDKLGTVGRPVHGAEVFLVDDAGHRLPRPPGQGAAARPHEQLVGEVVGRSPFMMAGYHNRPDATADIRWFDDEGRLHHRTGDIGRFDDEGFLTLLDRKKDIIISGGYNIHAVDLETVLRGHEAVLEVAVIGVPSAQWGESPLALVVTRPGAAVEADALRDWANARLGKLQRLVAVELREGLPRSALGKLSKQQLRAPYWQKAAPA